MSESLKALRARASRTFGDTGVAEAARRLRAIIGADFPEVEAEARSAMEKLERGEVPTPPERAALVRMMGIMRPSLLSRGGRFSDLPDYQHHEPGLVTAWNDFRDQMGTRAQSVGLVETADGAAIGTGFVAIPGGVLTNRHVLNALSAGTFELSPGQAIVRFGVEYESAALEIECPVTGVVDVSESEDLALLDIGDMPDTLAVLAVADHSIGTGDRIVTVGYPQKDPRNPQFVPAIYGGRFGVLRGAPGEVLDIVGTELRHDCSTLGGNSGSPVLAMSSTMVAGVHREGPLFLFRNEAVAAPAVRAFLDHATGSTNGR